LSITVSETETTPVLGTGDTGRIVDLLLAIPHGVLGMSAEVPGLVETSTNLAAIHVEGNTLKILTSQRSSRPSMIAAAAERVAATIRLGGGSVRFGEGYPAWPPRPESPLVDTAVAVFTRRFGRDPEVGAFHAGLECGVIGDKVGDMDMISFGPDMSGVHTPDERISISSTERTWELLLDILRALDD
jgi:dipeptidase D